MAKKGSFRYTTDDEGNLVVQRLAQHRTTGETRWIDQGSEIPEGLTMSGGKITGRNISAERASRQQARRYALNQYNKGQAAVQRSEEAGDMSFFEKLPIIAGRETDKLLAGAGDVVDFYRDVSNPEPFSFDEAPKGFSIMENLSDAVLGPPSEGPKRSYERSKEQASKDEYFEQLGDKAGLAQIGAVAPYYLTGLGLPAATRQAGAMITGVKEGVKEGGRRVGGYAGDIVRRQAAKEKSVPTQLAQEAERIILDPIEKVSHRFKARPNVKHEFREGSLKQLGGSAALGAAEGGLHYDESALEGMANSVIGTGLGKIYEPVTSRAPSKLGDSEQEVLEWAKDKGYRALPGVELAQPKYRMKESGLRNDERYAGAMRQLDDANDEVFTRVVGETMGFSPESMRKLTPASLQTHLEDLSSQYKALEEASVGRIDKSALKDLQSSINELPQTKDGRNAFKTMQGMLDEIKGLNKGGKRDKRGRFKAYTFDGKDYQKTRTMLKQHADTAYDKNRVLYGELKKALKLLDDGMEAGLKSHGGEASATMWKDLNERYAMTKLVMNKGMDPVGGVNMTKLSNHFMENDPERLLLNQGGRVSNLHKLSKLKHMEKDRAESGLVGPGIEHIEKQQKTESQRLLNTPAQLNIPLRRWAMIRAYQSGWPASSGVLGLPREGRGSMPAITRMMEQGTDAHQDAGQAILDKGTEYKDAAKERWDQLMELLNQYE